MTEEIKEKFKLNFPNACTLLNAMCGVLALLFALFYANHDVVYFSCSLICLGGVFDGLDGKFARRYNVTSELGKQLDSFADLITFVIAPVCVFLTMHSLSSSDAVNLIEILIAAFYVGCGIFRLARYNTTPHTFYFEGLPTTAAGMFMSLYIFISNYFIFLLGGCWAYTVVSYLIIVFLAIAMVSKLRVNRL